MTTTIEAAIGRDTGEEACERCGNAVAGDARRIALTDRSTAAQPRHRGRRIERTVCAVCAETVAELFRESAHDAGLLGPVG